MEPSLVNKPSGGRTAPPEPPGRSGLASSPSTAAYEAALPDDPRVERKQMFGKPCAFVNRQMFFGTFEDSVVARVGPARAEELVGTPGIQVFAPMPERAWVDYVQVDIAVAGDRLKGLAAEALAWTLRLPPKVKQPKPKKDKKAGKKQVPAGLD